MKTVITVAHTKGGVGKSTMAWHLAFSMTHKKVTVIDLDFQQTLYFVNVLADNALNIVQPWTVSDLIDYLDNAADDEMIIIDVGGFDNDINRAAIERSDHVLIPISDSITEVIGFKTFDSIIEQIDTKAQFSVFLNNIHPLTKNFDDIKEAVQHTGMNMLNTVVRRRNIYKTSMAAGKSVFQSDNIEAREEIQGIRDEILQTR